VAELALQSGPTLFGILSR